jgi:hypothetical protein
LTSPPHFIDSNPPALREPWLFPHSFVRRTCFHYSILTIQKSLAPTIALTRYHHTN